MWLLKPPVYANKTRQVFINSASVSAAVASPVPVFSCRPRCCHAVSRAALCRSPPPDAPGDHGRSRSPSAFGCCAGTRGGAGGGKGRKLKKIEDCWEGQQEGIRAESNEMYQWLNYSSSYTPWRFHCILFFLLQLMEQFLESYNDLLTLDDLENMLNSRAEEQTSLSSSKADELPKWAEPQAETPWLHLLKGALANQKRAELDRSRRGWNRGCFGLKLDRIGSMSGLGC